MWRMWENIEMQRVQKNIGMWKVRKTSEFGNCRNVENVGVHYTGRSLGFNLCVAPLLQEQGVFYFRGVKMMG